MKKWIFKLFGIKRYKVKYKIYSRSIPGNFIEREFPDELPYRSAQLIVVYMRNYFPQDEYWFERIY
jgi:hypothetical protein